MLSYVLVALPVFVAICIAALADSGATKRFLPFPLFFVVDTLQRLFYGHLPDYYRLSGVPAPTALPDFDIHKALPRPYRPFRWEYHQTMSLKKLDSDWWIELESTYFDRLAQRKKLYELQGKKVLDAWPGSELACKELMEMVIQYVCTRYPRCFTYNSWTMMFHNHLLGSIFDTKTIDPLIFLLENIPEDFLITQPDPTTGLYHMRGGVVCSALGWNVATKIGKPLHEIHDPIPDYKEKMQFSMDRFFSKMPCDKPIQRGSWGFEVGEPLFLMPDDPHWAYREKQDPSLKLDDIYLRVDWQILRRLPRSQTILFNYKALFTPVTQLRNEPYIPRLVLKVLREGKPSIMAYKGTWHVEHVLIPALDTWSREQEEKSWVPKDWQERTLDEDPYYPGWRDQWDSCYKA